MRHAWSLGRPRPVYVNTPEKEAELKHVLDRVDLAAIDTETTGLDTQRDLVVYWSVSTGDDRYFLKRGQLEAFRSQLEDPNRAWIGSQIKFDVHMLHNTGIRLGGDLLCTLTMDRLLDPAQPHGLKEIYERFFNERMMTFDETFYPLNDKGKPVKPRNKPMYQVMTERFESDPDRVIDYASLDAWAAFRCATRLKQELKRVRTWAGNTLWDIFCWYEVPLTRILFEMERIGIRLDVDYLASTKPQIVQRRSEIEAAIAKIAGHIVNIDSPPQLVRLFFTELQLEPLEMTKGGENKAAQPSTSKTVLKSIASQGGVGGDVAQLVLEHRALGKMLGTYVHGLLGAVDDKGRVHTTFNQHVADTGRLSSSEPNLQNQIRSGSAFLNIRKAFIASPGCMLGVADYDQLEMYVLGHFSKDRGLIDAARSGRDIHAALTELIYGEPYDEIIAAKEAKVRTPRQKWLKELRDAEKAVSFGLIYGKAERAMARDLGLVEKVRAEYPEWSDEGVMDEAAYRAKEIIETFFRTLSLAQVHVQHLHEWIKTERYIESFLGRRRYFLEAMSPADYNEHLYQARRKGQNLCWCKRCDTTRECERQGTNHEIQGTAADIVQLAMILLRNDSRLQELGFRMLLQVHDEIVFEFPIMHEAEVCTLVQYHMEHPGLALRVPLRAKPGTGASWAQAKG